MQRAGKRECPLCRAPVLATADGRESYFSVLLSSELLAKSYVPRPGNLDKAAMEFMRLYFPREVKVKQRENEKEVAREDVEDMGMQEGCVVC